jgi:hypothetical protein
LLTARQTGHLALLSRGAGFYWAACRFGATRCGRD